MITNPFLPFRELTNKVNQIIDNGAKTKMTDKEFLEKQISDWLVSPGRMAQLQGNDYYKGVQEILKKTRSYTNSQGKEVDLTELPNNKLIDNQYARIVDQKVNFLMAKPFSLNIEGEFEEYSRLLKGIFSKRSIKNIKKALKDAYNGGLGWIYPYVDEQGNLMIKRFEPWEILPMWKDGQHEDLDFAVRFYPVVIYEGTKSTVVNHVEVYTKTGISKYIYTSGGALIADEGFVDSSDFGEEPYFVQKEADSDYAIGWDKVPLIPIKSNDLELPLLNRVRTLQDALNKIMSIFGDNMEQDIRNNTVLVIRNYDGIDLAEFKKNLMELGCIKVSATEGSNGGVDTLNIEVNADNYKAILEILKKAMIENAMAYDADALKTAGSPNEMSIQSIFNDINIAADETELELQVSMEDLFYFIDKYLMLNNQGNYEDVYVDVIFNRSMIINTSQTITDIRNSIDIVSKKTLLSQHPWVHDVQSELDQIELEQEQEQEKADVYKDAFGFSKGELDENDEEEPGEDDIDPEDYDNKEEE